MITVHGRWVRPDGTPAVGRIGLQLAPPGGTHHAGGWVQQTEPAQIVTTPVQWADLVDGEMQMEVMASDDPTWHQSPRGYVLVVDIDGQSTTMGGVLLLAPGPIDLSGITPMPVEHGVMVVPVPGPPNRLTVDAVTVDPGQDCTATISGTPPDQHIRFGLAQGQPGKPGPATELTVDAVAVDPDQPCTATISGTPPDQHIRFGLAQGQPGKPGPATALTVDAVTLDPDRLCTATITGDPPNQHIRFGLARGAPGVNDVSRVSRPNGTDLWMQHRLGDEWVTTSYDSGWRNISNLLEPGWSGTVRIRRVGPVMWLHADPIRAAADAGDCIWKPPGGFAAPPSWGTARGVSIPDGSQGLTWMVITLNPYLRLMSSGGAKRDTNYWGLTMFPIEDRIPASLPGNAG